MMMKLMLDESIPRKLAGHFPDQVVISTVLSAYRTRLTELAPLIPEVVELLESGPEIGVYRVAV